MVEFTHMVMGPTCGMVFADLGAEVIKVEPPKGDNTRNLLGSGAGFTRCLIATKSPSPSTSKPPRAAKQCSN